MTSMYDLRLIQAQIDAANIDPTLEAELHYLIDDLANIHHMLDEADLPGDPERHEAHTLSQRFRHLLNLYHNTTGNREYNPSPPAEQPRLFEDRAAAGVGSDFGRRPPGFAAVLAAPQQPPAAGEGQHAAVGGHHDVRDPHALEQVLDRKLRRGPGMVFGEACSRRQARADRRERKQGRAR